MERLDTLWDRAPLRRAFYGLAGLVLFAGLVVALNARGSSSQPTGPIVPGSASRDAQLFGEKIPLPQQASQTVQQFVHGAVLRDDLAGAWDISTPAVHGGTSRAQWMSGTIPVLPFPDKAFDKASIHVEYSRERGSLLLVSISSKDPAVRFEEFFTELAKVNGSWKVAYWGPRGTNPPIPKSKT